MDAKKRKLGERLKLARTINDLTLEEVANQLETNKIPLSHYESGERKPSYNTLDKLASIYKIPNDFLIMEPFIFHILDNHFLILIIIVI